ncbi:HNH endonuclease signature motif containing protein [Halomonas faecis]|uniref:HNH endonuclease signature motif containing protein n=1 Tax=Halomonas faecis TaxID=1562110 RepID=UPI0013D4AFEF|nr:HNH endonuclease signature motif containing protein [Halomonas faecis]
MSKRTVNALLARGIDSKLAESLSAKKHTMASLKQMPQESLLNLGFSSEQAERLLQEPRPPIPEETLLRVLYRSRRTCCVCRDPKKSVVVHHIDEWASSRNHSESNLIVLCLDHHDLAHTRKELSQGLSRSELITSKENWETDVTKLDAKAILALKNSRDFSRWDWVNIQRVFELAIDRSIACTNTKITGYLRSRGYLDGNGFLSSTDNWAQHNPNGFWFTDISDGMYISWYLSNIVDQVLESTPVIDITSFIPYKSELKSVLSEGDYFVAQLPFYFSDIDNNERGKTQMRRSYYRGYGVRIEYTFDAWLCLSSSARYDAMTGRKVKTVFGLVRSITDEDGELLISVSCLAAGTAFEPHAARSA